MKWNRKLQMWVRNPKHRRSLGGLLMFIIMAPFLICVLACLDAPIGDPETSRVDPKLTGVWLGKIEDDLTLLVLQPFDKRTYLVGWFWPESDVDAEEGENPEKKAPKKDGANEDDAKPKGVETKLNQINLKRGTIFKGWLTTIGGHQFMCWEPRFVVDTKEGGMKTEEWWGFKVILEKNRLTLALVDARKAGETTKEIEKFIKANYLDNKKFKDKDLWHFKKIDKSKYYEVAKALEKMGISGLK